MRRRIFDDSPTVEPVGVGLCGQRLIPTGEHSSLQTHIATTGSVSLCAAEKLTASIELESAIRACDESA